MDAITLLKNDHKTVEALFRQFEKAGDRAFVEKRKIVDQVIEALSIHTSIEEQVFYPVARATIPETETVVLGSLEEHHVVKWLLAEIADLDPTHERFNAKVTVLIENVRHHVREEEGVFFPIVRRALGRTALSDLGDALANAKTHAPTHPHPKAPDTPPRNSLVGAIMSTVDRVSDNLSEMAQGGLGAAEDLVARILQTQTPKTSPSGRVKTTKRATGTAGTTGKSGSAKRAAGSAAKTATKTTVAVARKATSTGPRSARGSQS